MLSLVYNFIPQALERDAAAHGLSWFLRLRWMAMLGQIVACAVVGGIMDVRLPLEWLGLCIIVSLITNILVVWLRGRIPWDSNWIVFILLALDTATLTGMLYLTGGAHNPFSIFYLLHIAIAALLLSGCAMWFIFGESILGFATLFLSPYELQCEVEGIGFMTFHLHLQGMLIALVLCGGFLAYFVSRLVNDLQLVQSELEKVRTRSERSRFVSALGTLAAGAAHELSTPLATIAIASKEIANQSYAILQNPDFKDDALLISSQVERCQQILRKLNLDALMRQTSLDEPTCINQFPELLRREFVEGDFARLHFVGFRKGLSVRCAPDPLLQSLRSLIHNALLATNKHSQVNIHVEQIDAEFVFSVSDDGSGMNNETIEKVGDPFFTTRAPGEGMGLGIFLVRMFCESVNGNLTYKSHPNGGTVAILSVPITDRYEP